jgi:oxygen-independent coproporphyrinogen-3 oxidase
VGEFLRLSARGANDFRVVFFHFLQKVCKGLAAVRTKRIDVRTAHVSFHGLSVLILTGEFPVRSSSPYNGCNVPLGLYISVPFCRTKCSYCNFASDVFSKSAYESYVARVIEDISGSQQLASELGCAFDEKVDSIYLGGGTPSILGESQLLRIFDAVRAQFTLTRDAEITVECAPGTLTPSLIETLLKCGVNRASLGVQSFVDQEAQSVGRLHKRSTVLEETSRLREAGLNNINIDLIAGLPHQTGESWTFSLAETIALGAPHVSVYMLEVDEDSRLGRELIAGGTRYHAHFVPDDEATADFYSQACETLNAAGVAQYEISNFARPGAESRHNLKYWTRQPYLGFGIDAHSMLPARGDGTSAAKAANENRAPTAALKHCATQKQSFFSGCEAVPFPKSLESGFREGRVAGLRFSTPHSLDAYMNRTPHTVTAVSRQAAIEESFFLGLRLNRGVDLTALAAKFTPEAIAPYQPVIFDCLRDGLLEKQDTMLCLTPRGRLLSNEVFARFLVDKIQEEAKVGTGHVNTR